MADKISQKELAQPDWFHTEFAKLVALFSQYRKQIIWVAGIVALLLIFGSGWYLYQINYEKKAGLMYAQARKAAHTGDPASRESNTIRLLEDLVVKYPRSRAAVMAYYRLGNLYYNLTEIDHSIDAYRELIKKAPSDSDLVTLAHSSIGFCYEAKRDFPKALASFEDAVRSPGGRSFEAINYRNIARVYEEMNNAGKAGEYYRKALEKTTDPVMSLMLKRKISMLVESPGASR